MLAGEAALNDAVADSLDSDHCSSRGGRGISHPTASNSCPTCQHGCRHVRRWWLRCGTTVHWHHCVTLHCSCVIGANSLDHCARTTLRLEAHVLHCELEWAGASD